MGDFKEHGLVLYLSRESYLGFIKLQADKGLGRSFAGQLAFTEGLFKLGYLSKGHYEELVKRYSQGLISEEYEKEKNKPKTIIELQEQLSQNQLERSFGNVIKQWPEMKPKAREYWIEKAAKHKDVIPNASLRWLSLLPPSAVPNASQKTLKGAATVS